MLKILIMVAFLLFPSLADAHIVVNGNKSETLNNIKVIEDYFKDNFNLTLLRDIAVINAGTTKEYQDYLEYFKVANAEEVAKRSGAITSGDKLIIINTAGLGRDERLFLLAHEMTHQYQFQQKGKAAVEDMAMLEGFADIIANDISGVYIKIRNHGIGRDKLKSYNNFKEMYSEYGSIVYEQARYYAKSEKFLNYYSGSE